jgi:phage gp29-like protein
MVTIVDSSGNPIQRDNLGASQTAEITPLQRLYATHPSRGLTPARLASILHEAELGYIVAQHDLFTDMEEKDAHIYAEMAKRKRALLTVDWDIIPPRNASATERKLAGYAKELLQDVVNFEDVIVDALDAIGHGFSCQEMEWQMVGSEWMPKKIELRPQSWFQTDRATRSQIRLRDMSPDGQELWPFGWITHVHKAKSGYLSRGGLHRVLAWPYLFKNYAAGDLAEFLEIYGLPLRIGKYPSGSGEPEKATLLDALASLGHNAAGIIPEGMMIEILEAAKGSHTPFEAMISWCERSESKAILGGTLTSQADGKSSTNALGNVHDEVRHDILEADAKQLARTFTRDLVFPILMLNKGGIDDIRRCPRLAFAVQETEDITEFADALPKLVGAGMKRIKVDWVHEKLGIPKAEEGDEVLTIAQPEKVLPESERAAPQPSAAATSAAALSQEADPTFPDQVALDDALAAIAPAELQGQAVEALKPVVRMIVASADYAEVHQALAEIFPNMNTQQLEDTLARAMFVAEVFGRVTKED